MNFAGYGTDHKGFGRCKFHGGSTPNHMTQAVAEAVAARSLAHGEPVVIDPMDALVSEVHRTAGHIAWLGAELQQHPDPATFEARVLGQLAAAITEASGVAVVYADVPPAEHLASLVDAGVPEPVAAVLVDVDLSTAHGALLVETGDLSSLTGHPTTSMGDALKAAIADAAYG